MFQKPVLSGLGANPFEESGLVASFQSKQVSESL
jgi:hypothetical protein